MHILVIFSTQIKREKERESKVERGKVREREKDKSVLNGHLNRLDQNYE